MTYENVRDAIAGFLQEFRSGLKKEHDLFIEHVTNTSTAHTSKNIHDLETKNQLATYGGSYGDEPLTDASMKLLNTLISLCEDQYVHPDTHPASIIVTTPGRRFVTDTQIAEFNNKAGKIYVDECIDELRSDLNIDINNVLMNIVNMKNPLQILQSISVLLNEDDNLEGLLYLLSDKVDVDLFEEHKQSQYHLSDDNVALLNLLTEFINNDGIDWNADPNTDGIHAIKNKPKALPAKGGDADSICGRGIKQLLSGKKTATIIGKKGYSYTQDSCDYWCDGDDDSKIIQSAIDSLIDGIGGEIYIREGEYNISKGLTLSRDENTVGAITIRGCSGATILNFNSSTLTFSNNINIEDLYIKSSDIILNNNIHVDNIKITDSKLKITKEMNYIKDCDIINTTIANADGSINNMITNNRLVKSELPLFTGDNYIQNNYIIK